MIFALNNWKAYLILFVNDVFHPYIFLISMIARQTLAIGFLFICFISPFWRIYNPIVYFHGQKNDCPAFEIWSTC